MKLSSPVAALLRDFHAQKPARIWSLIVTLYGDAILPRGGSLWVGSLIEIMALFGIDAGHVRTAISRLTSDGWLTASKRGRNSYYRLSKRGEAEFAAAGERIYAPRAKSGSADVWIALLAPGGARQTQRNTLEQSGFVMLQPGLFLGLREMPGGARKDIRLARLCVDADAAAMVATAYRLDPLADGYRQFVTRLTPLARALERTQPSAAEALVARTLMVHAFRRLALRDPGLPQALLPPDWPERDARMLAAAIDRELTTGSEVFLDNAQNEKGSLPAAKRPARARFSGR